MGKYEAAGSSVIDTSFLERAIDQLLHGKDLNLRFKDRGGLDGGQLFLAADARLLGGEVVGVDQLGFVSHAILRYGHDGLEP